MLMGGGDRKIGYVRVARAERERLRERAPRPERTHELEGIRVGGFERRQRYRRCVVTHRPEELGLLVQEIASPRPHRSRVPPAPWNREDDVAAPAGLRAVRRNRAFVALFEDALVIENGPRIGRAHV